MIPFFQFNYFIIGFLTIQVWGLLVAAGIISAVTFGRKLSKKYLLSEEVFVDAAIWMLFSAMFFARVFHILFYDLQFFVQHPSEILKFWHGGESSLGGFFGAFFALYIFVKLRRFKIEEFRPYLDVMAISLWLGWGIGRVGCFLIHDHPGVISNFFLAVKFPGGSRLDLGLLESILAFIIFALFYKYFARLIKKQWGLVAAYSLLSYSAGRFVLDFFRASDIAGSDVRYAYLTPAQWGMILVILSLTLTLFSGRIRQVFKKKENL